MCPRNNHSRTTGQERARVLTAGVVVGGVVGAVTVAGYAAASTPARVSAPVGSSSTHHTSPPDRSATRTTGGRLSMPENTTGATHRPRHRATTQHAATQHAATQPTVKPAAPRRQPQATSSGS